MIYLTSSGAHLDESDGVEYLAITKNIVDNHSIKLPANSDIYVKTGLNETNKIKSFISSQTGTPVDQIHNLNDVYAPYGLVLSFMAVPLYYLASLIHAEPIHFVPFFLNPIVLSLTSLVIFLTAKEIFSSYRISFILCIVFGVCSFIWPYINTMWQQPLVGLVLISSLYFLLLSGHTKKSYYVILSAILLGSEIFVHPGLIIVIPGMLIFSLYVLAKRKTNLKIYFLSFLPFVVLQGMLNKIRFGSILDFGYQQFEGLNVHSGTEGILGLIMSTGYGIIFYFPLFLLVPISIYFIYRNYSKSLSLLIVFEFVSVWIFFGTLEHPLWSFGNWGPRYFTTILPLLTLPLGAFLVKCKEKISWKIIFIVLSVAGFSINILGILVWHMYGLSYGWEVDGLSNLKDSWYVFTWNPYYSPIVQAIKVLNSNYLSHVPGIHTNTYQIIGLAPCKYDNYLYCNYNILYNLILGILIGMVFLLLKRKIIRNNLTTATRS
ncbi:MAG: hypothetical protein ABI342_02790 [Nitrososphaera sp.]